MKTKIIKLIGKCIKKDRDHHVVIAEDYVAGRTSLPNYLCDDFKIEDGKITVFATGDREPVIDGATCAPDKLGKLDIAAGYILHDLFYVHLEDISAKWRTDVKNVRKVADDILENAIAQQKCAGSKLVSKIYYAAVKTNSVDLEDYAKKNDLSAYSKKFKLDGVELSDGSTTKDLKIARVDRDEIINGNWMMLNDFGECKLGLAVLDASSPGD